MADDNYYRGLDRYMAPREENRFLSGKTTGEDGPAKLSDPIVPLSKLGTTFAEKGPGGQGGIVQSMLASIRQGTGTLQLAMQTGTDQVMGGGFGSMGKDVRQAIKEVIKASEVQWEGLEMPTSSMSNMSGWDNRQGFSEQKRQKDIQSVRDAINFAVDIGAGGAIDVWSQEFARGINNASFKEAKGADDMDKQFVEYDGFDEAKDSVYYLVDERTGRLDGFSTGQLGGKGPTISVPMWKRAQKAYQDSNGVMVQPGDYIDASNNKLQADSDNPRFLASRVQEWNAQKGGFEAKEMDWEEFKRYAAQRNKEEGKNLSPEQWLKRTQYEGQFMQANAQAQEYKARYEQEMQVVEQVQSDEFKKKLSQNRKQKDELSSRFEKLRSQIKDDKPSQEQLQELQFLDYQLRSVSDELEKQEQLEKQRPRVEQQASAYRELSSQQEAQAREILDMSSHLKPVEEFGRKKTAQSYAQMGIYAMEQTSKHDVLRPISVGPELGWPQQYGGHTDEFITVVKDARAQMVKEMQQNPRYRNKYSNQQMEELAKKHIGGVLDTSHLSMWYNHFPHKDGQSEEERLKEFNKWYMKQMDKLAKEEVVASVQIVDSATGDHRHLPPGQGPFNTIDAVKRLQAGGFDGPILSEGHEDEASDPGRIQYSLWEAYGASMGTTPHHFSTAPTGNSFNNVFSGAGAAGYRAPPNYIAGAYNPSNEWKLWSETPLE